MTAALDYVRALPASERTRLVQHAASLLSNETPATVAALISTLPQSAAQTEVISRFSGDFCRAEPGAAMDWIKSLPEGGAREAALGDASARALAQYDPRTAADFAGGLPPGSGRSQFLSVALDEWFRSDARSATDWLTGWLKANSNPGDGSGNGDLLSRLGNRWGKTDPQAALNFAQGLVPNQQHPFLMEAGAAWAMTDSKAALDAVGRLPEGPARDSFLLGLAGGLAQVAPEQAAHVVSSLVQPGNQQIAAQSVVRQWVKTDPQAAAAWVANFPENMRREAVTIVADSWAAHDPKAVGQWLGSLPAGHSVDRAIANYIDRTGRKFPALAAPLVGRISDAADRERYVETLATAWLRTDPAAAQAWLAQTGLPSERQQQLLKRR